MQQLIYVAENNVKTLNCLLVEGWEVVDIKTFCRPGAEGGYKYNSAGDYGCYVLLEKDKIK